MWKIVKLRLKNFIQVYAGMGKREVQIDLLNNTNSINIFIGKMGSGKSSILGHLQPYSSYGTLDIRNQESMIIPGEDGIKEITYICRGTVYEILHKYTWNKNSESHNVKSYIKVDGIEKNENGNSKSFKEIIKVEFGIDQSYLQLLRLGTNVTNIISMKSTDRKAFIASLLKDSQIYSTIYQKISEEYRAKNAALSLLSNKLIGLSTSSEETLKDNLELMEIELSKLSKSTEDMKSQMARLSGINETILQNNGKGDIYSLLFNLKEIVAEQAREIDNYKSQISSVEDYDTNELISYNEKLSNELLHINEEIIRTQVNMDRLRIEKNKLQDIILISDNNDQIEILRKSEAELKERYESSKSKLFGFNCKYSKTFLKSLIDTIDSFQVFVEDIGLTDNKVLATVYKSDGTIKNWAGKLLEKSKNYKLSLEKLLVNMEFASEYTSPIILYRPPMCPTNTCPYMQSHPAIIARDNPNPKSSIQEAKNQIDKVDKQISLYEDYLSVWRIMTQVKSLWKQIYQPLYDIGALKYTDLYGIITRLDYRGDWYDHNVLIDTIEKVTLLEDFNAIENAYYQTQNELLRMDSADIGNKKAEYIEKEKEYEELSNDMNKHNTQKDTLSKEKDTLDETLQIASSIDIIKAKLEHISKSYIDTMEQIATYEMSISMIRENENEISRLKQSIQSSTHEYNVLSDKKSRVMMTLQDISSTKSSYEEYLLERDIDKLILDAVSSKDGIPLIYVKRFLDDCKEIINDLISNVFDDDLEIAEFAISENDNEFNIPYYTNGKLAKDIKLASQGQQAIISIAISFALCKKSAFDYNIMLLDEVDSCIHAGEREKFIHILFNQMELLNTEQVFLITHNDIFQHNGLPVNIITTSQERVDLYEGQCLIELQ